MHSTCTRVSHDDSYVECIILDGRLACLRLYRQTPGNKFKERARAAARPACNLRCSFFHFAHPKMPTTYSIEHAKSGRSSCKTKACGQKIDKGEVRYVFL